MESTAESLVGSLMAAQLLFMASIPGKPSREDHTVLTIEEALQPLLAQAIHSVLW